MSFPVQGLQDPLFYHRSYSLSQRVFGGIYPSYVRSERNGGRSKDLSTTLVLRGRRYNLTLLPPPPDSYHQVHNFPQSQFLEVPNVKYSQGFPWTEIIKYFGGENLLKPFSRVYSSVDTQWWDSECVLPREGSDFSFVQRASGKDDSHLMSEMSEIKQVLKIRSQIRVCVQGFRRGVKRIFSRIDTESTFYLSPSSTFETHRTFLISS